MNELTMLRGDVIVAAPHVDGRWVIINVLWELKPEPAK
jgi:hypothetical protein